MFIVSLTYLYDLAKVDEYLIAHRQYLDSLYARGKLLVSGGKKPRDGGIILAHQVTREELDELLTHDPFYQQGLARYEITEFTPRQTAESLAFLAD
ncbi:YciI family protein [Celerinatantimonas sp. YJH-8]|uniref:YciI family protein n=1 Tax=Celerinatantimonas sp. YJH-8 TaxID=3228714 RepID=UPI0038CB6CA9